MQPNLLPRLASRLPRYGLERRGWITRLPIRRWKSDRVSTQEYAVSLSSGSRREQSNQHAPITRAAMTNGRHEASQWNLQSLAAAETHNQASASGKSPCHRVKYVPRSISSHWNIAIASMTERFRNGNVQTGSFCMPVSLHPQTQRWTTKVVTRAKAPSTAGASHKIFSRRVLKHVMLWTLAYRPLDALHILENKVMHSRLDTYWLADSLYVLIKSWKSGLMDAPDMCNRLVRLVCALSKVTPQEPRHNVMLSKSLRYTSSHRLFLEAGHIRFLLDQCSTQSLLDLDTVIIAGQLCVHGYSLLHLAAALSRHRRVREAAQILYLVPDSGIDVTNKRFESVSTTILRDAIKQPDGSRLGLEILENLLRLGLQVNVQHCNVVLLNAATVGDMTTAWSVYDSIIDHGLQPDQYTHAILLKGCKATLQSPHNTRRTIEKAVESLDTVSAPTTVVAAEILHTLYLYHFRGSKTGTVAFGHLSNAYVNMFDQAPLIQLGVLGHRVEKASQNALLAPSPDVICIMVSAYLRTVRDSQAQFHVFQRLFQLARSGEAPFAELRETDYVWNVFLRSFTLTTDGLRLAHRAIRQLLEPGSEKSEPSDMSEEFTTQDIVAAKPAPATTDTDHTPAVTARSWSILLCGFIQHNRLDEADRLLHFMGSNGLQPTYSRMSWLLIRRGFAHPGDIRGAVSALRAMEAAGWHEHQRTRAVMSSLQAFEDPIEDQRGDEDLSALDSGSDNDLSRVVSIEPG